MRLLVCEFITGGGLIGADLPATLAREGDLMLERVLQDLSDCGEVGHIEVLRDPRLPAVAVDKCTTTPVHLDFWQTFSRCCAQVDAVLPIAPETDDILLKLTQIIQKAGIKLLNSREPAVHLAGSKRRTLDTLQTQGLPVVATYPAGQAPWGRHKHWVVKPDQGVGGEGCRLLNTGETDLQEDVIVQPFVSGLAASLTLLCAEGRAALVACNEQRIHLDERGCRLQSLRVNGLTEQHESLRLLADAVAAAMPELWGWVGVDIILTGAGPRVLEVNPRLTTSYAGLRQSLNCNPAQWLLDLLNTRQLPAVSMAALRPIEVVL